MNEQRDPHRSTRTARPEYRAPRTWTGLALYVGFGALVPLALFALAHPTAVAAAIAGLSVGLLARPLGHRLTRRSGRVERPTNAVGRAASEE
ncbi:hypothetical protein [Halorussus marinus]|uniref:hypothetical protein n=1 Tax=Halorussus marinus TaxID=2505976 RepID=UPI00106EB31E|nr:hypothetical protein [Halorussus marinus]